MSPKSKHMRLTHSLVTLSETKGLKYRFFAALRMTFLRGFIVKCTNVIWSDLQRFSHERVLGAQPSWLPNLPCTGRRDACAPEKGYIQVKTAVIFGFSPPTFRPPASHLSDPRRWILDSRLSASRPPSHVSRFPSHVSRFPFPVSHLPSPVLRFTFP
jgi:hypothetical protein